MGNCVSVGKWILHCKCSKGYYVFNILTIWFSAVETLVLIAIASSEGSVEPPHIFILIAMASSKGSVDLHICA